jgi:hypothetical protein
MLGTLLIAGGVLGALAVPGWAVVLLVLGFMGGIACIVLGMLAVVLSRAFEAIRYGVLPPTGAVKNQRSEDWHRGADHAR